MKDNWTIKVTNKEGETYTVNKGDHICDFKGRCGYVLSVNELPGITDPESAVYHSFTVDPGFGVMIEILFNELAYVTPKEEV